MIGLLLDLLISLFVGLIVTPLRSALTWWILAGALLLAALWWQSLPLAIVAAVVIAIRLVFAWLEQQARTPLIEPLSSGKGLPEAAPGEPRQQSVDPLSGPGGANLRIHEKGAPPLRKAPLVMWLDRWVPWPSGQVSGPQPSRPAVFRPRGCSKPGGLCGPGPLRR